MIGLRFESLDRVDEFLGKPKFGAVLVRRDSSFELYSDGPQDSSNAYGADILRCNLAGARALHGEEAILHIRP